MDATERFEGYVTQSGVSTPRLTPAQARRARRKERSRKTHAHTPGEPCLRCQRARRPETITVPQRIPIRRTGMFQAAPRMKEPGQ